MNTAASSSAPSFVLNNFLVTSEKLGSGGTSDVFLGYDMVRKRPVALKRSATSKTKMKDWDREVSVLNSLRGEPNVLTLLDVLFLPSNPPQFQDAYVFQVFELIEGKNLLELFNSAPQALTESLVRLMFYQIVDIIHRCHKRGVVHLDIKPENIMYDTAKGQIIIVDFGFAETFQHSNPVSISKRSGSVEYCAPEIYFDAKYDGQCSDVWSLGVLLYVLLYRKFPFIPKGKRGIKSSRDTPQQKQKYLQAMFEEKLVGECLLPENTSPALLNLFQGLLSPTPSHRFTAGQILRHEWFDSLRTSQSPAKAQNLSQHLPPQYSLHNPASSTIVQMINTIHHHNLHSNPNSKTPHPPHIAATPQHLSSC